MSLCKEEISPLLDALCFLFSKQRVWENRWEPRDASQVPQRWIDQNSSEFSLRLNWPHWSGVIFPAGWAGSLHYCASSRGTSVRSEAVAPLTAAALTVSKAHIACRAKCQVSGLACAYAMGAAAYPAIWISRFFSLGKFLFTHRTCDLWCMGLERWLLGCMFVVARLDGAHTGLKADRW